MDRALTIMLYVTMYGMIAVICKMSYVGVIVSNV